MQIDRYTKAMLTLIAGSLLALVAQNAIRSAGAESAGLTKVVICDPEAERCARVVETGPNDKSSRKGGLEVWSQR